MPRILPVGALAAFVVVLLALPMPSAMGASPAPRALAPSGPVAHVGVVAPPGPAPAGSFTSFGPWVNLSAASVLAPAGRSSVPMAYDPLLGEIVLFGGYDPSPSGPFGDTWTFAAGNWTNITGNLTLAPP